MIKVKITDYLYTRNEEQQQIFMIFFFQIRSSYYKKTVHQVLQVSLFAESSVVLVESIIVF